MQLLNFATLIKIEDTWMYAFMDDFVILQFKCRYISILRYTICILLSCYFGNVNRAKTKSCCALYNSDVYRDATALVT